ncbi:hypothetical protein BH23ACT6_BH23ACT6_14920 [soil metagenome]
MGDTLAPGVAVVVVVAFFVLAMAVPFIATQARASVELWRGVSVLAAVVAYVAALLAYTVLPLPSTTAMERRCAQGRGAEAQLVPLHFLADVGRDAASEGLSLLADPVLGQVMLNVALFVPLGFGLRLLRGMSTGAIVATAVASSAVIEVSQGTGLWFVYDCAYRVMDVDDVLANTLGAAAGLAVALWVQGRRAKLTG